MLKPVILSGHIWLLLIPSMAFAQDNATPPPPSVTVSTVVSKDITPHFSYVGRVEAVDSVDLRARVEGFLQVRHFQEGEDVKTDQLLFEIEQAPYQAVVAQREADLASAEATLTNADLTLTRYESLRDKGTVSQADLDKAVADEAAAKAAVLQAEAALQRAQLDLSYTQVKSPLDGRISQARYSVGNLVSSSSDPLATVTSLDPVHVTIAVSEKDLIETRRQGIDLQNPKVEPLLLLSDGSSYAYGGRFDYLDSEVNQGTDTVLARAEFPNPDRLLIPGQFVTVIVKQKEAVTALVVPQASVQKDQQGYFVLVVNQANKVEVRRVSVGDQVGTDWVISDGLAQNERVIVQGIQKVQPDLEVNPVSADN